MASSSSYGAVLPLIRRHSLARLYLRAVLPTLAAFAEEDRGARERLEKWRFAVRFASSSGVSTTLAFRDGSVVVDPSPGGLALRLLFLSDREVIRAFRREGTPWVLPWGGLHHLVRLPELFELFARMGDALKGRKAEPTESDSEALRVRLLFGTLLPAAMAELGVHESQCRRLLAPFGSFEAELCVPHVIRGWIARHGDSMAWGQGRAPHSPDLRIEFRDAAIACAAVDGLIDQLAACVAGEISIRGMIPLADALAQVMEMASTSLEPGRSCRRH